MAIALLLAMNCIHDFVICWRGFIYMGLAWVPTTTWMSNTLRITQWTNIGSETFTHKINSSTAWTRHHTCYVTSLFKSWTSSSRSLYSSVNTVWTDPWSFSDSFFSLWLQRLLGGTRFHNSESFCPIPRIETCRRSWLLNHLYCFIDQTLCISALLTEKTVEFHIQSVGFDLIFLLIIIFELCHSFLVKFALVVRA